jgi:hypothetical protein
MCKQEIIEQIVDIVEEYGSFNICEVNYDHAIVVKKVGKNTQEVVDKIDSKGVDTTVYVADIDTESNIYPYEELSEEVLSDILVVCKKFEEIQ